MTHIRSCTEPRAASPGSLQSSDHRDETLARLFGWEASSIFPNLKEQTVLDSSDITEETSLLNCVYFKPCLYKNPGDNMGYLWRPVSG